MRTFGSNTGQAFTASLLMLALGACGSAGSREGNLGRGMFSYKCVDQTDSACKTSMAGPLEFPSSIAVGARFRLAYMVNGDPQAAGFPTLRPVSQEYLQSAGDTFTALRAGYGAVIARSTTTGDVIDYTLIKLNPVMSIRVYDPDGNLPPPTVTLTRGAMKEYLASATGSHGESLVGTLDYTWSSSMPGVVALQQGNPTSRMKILATAAGTSVLTASLGTQKLDLTITVTP